MSSQHAIMHISERVSERLRMHAGLPVVAHNRAHCGLATRAAAAVTQGKRPCADNSCEGLELASDVIKHTNLGAVVPQIVTEPPNGLRPNLRASFSRITDAMLSECSHPVRPAFTS